MYGDEVENVNVPSQLIGPVTYGKTTVEATNLDGKDDVSGLLTESTEEDWGWGAGRPKAGFSMRGVSMQHPSLVKDL